MALATLDCSLGFLSFILTRPRGTMISPIPSYCSSNFILPFSVGQCKCPRLVSCSAKSRTSSSIPDTNPSSNQPSKPKRPKARDHESKISENGVKDSKEEFPSTIPKRPRRGRRSEAAAVENFVRDSLEQTFASIREQNSRILENSGRIMKDRVDDDTGSDQGSEDEDDHDDSGEKKMMIEEEDPNWPLDADVGWGIRASEYFEKHSIKNVVGEDGVEIAWEREIDDGWVKEINCLEWERFAFHPSPLIVLVFERYNRASENWKVLKELEKAALVYWRAKDRLPPRTVKIDINIERDLAYALKVKDCPQILFLRGNKILYREKEIRTADQLVQMIAHFYYNAKKPSWIECGFVSSVLE